MNANEESGFERSTCPVANLLDVVGDRWTLLVVRDLLLGKTRYGEFAGSAEGIPTNLLSDRLKKLEQAGIVLRTPYSDRPIRYEYALTEKGRDFLPILDAMAAWATKHMPGTRVFPRWNSPE